MTRPTNQASFDERGRIPHSALATGQAVAEYAVLIGVVTAALLGMQLYAKRGLEAGIKLAADQISPYLRDAQGDPDGRWAQFAGSQYEAGDRTDKVFAKGVALDNASSVATDSAQTTTLSMPTGSGGALTRAVAPGQEVATTQGILRDCGTEEVDGMWIPRPCPPNTASYSRVVIDVR